MAEKKTNSRSLSQEQYFELRTLMAAKLGGYETLPLHREPYAQLMSKELGFDIAPSAVDRVCAAIGIGPRKARPTSDKKIDELDAYVTELCRAVADLKQRVAQLEANQLGKGDELFLRGVTK